MTDSVVDKFYCEASDLLKVLDNAKEISLRSTANDILRKTLLISTASYFETRITEIVLSYVKEKTIGTSLVTSFVQNKAVNRQYHTWFEWDGKNANSFFGLFGKEFREFMVNRVRANTNLASAISAFLELGSNRNRLVHQNYYSFTMEHTSDGIYGLYHTAMTFIEDLPLALREYSSVSNDEETLSEM